MFCLLSALCPSVFEPNLDPRFREVDLEGHLLPHEDVWIPGLVEQGLQNVELGSGEGRALPTLFSTRVAG